MKDDVLPKLIQYRFEEMRRSASGVDVGTIVANCQAELAAIWDDADKRLAYCPAKELLTRINRQLQSHRFKAVNAYSLSMELQRHEIPEEFRNLLKGIEQDTR